MQMPKEMPMFPIGFGAFLVWVSGYGRTEPMSGWGSVLVLLTVVLYMVPGAGLEPARPQWPGDFKCLATASRYISVHLTTATTSTTKPIFM